MKNFYLILFEKITRILWWVQYKLGNFRTVSFSLNVFKEFKLKDIENELKSLINLVLLTGLDSYYLRDMVRVKSSACIIMILRMKGNNVEVTSDISTLIREVEKTFDIKINNENEILLSCDSDNRVRLSILNVLLR